ncbi:hypothetical protein C3L33_20913, partial [Rhododendron williamsianum]
MFPWNIAKSAEAMFSRWAIKRVCKFLLKKKLGQFILGEIDLNQLDVQLRAGTIQLSDLALNVDYLNQKVGAATSIIVKEGSIGSLLVTMPWKGTGCEIEVEELELVLGPREDLKYQYGSQTSIARQDDNNCLSNELGKLDNEKVENTPMSASMDVHEGVKTVAKMVKWLLTSFHLKVKKLIVAFDSSLVGNEKNMKFCRTLVLRITDVECGARISEEVSSKSDTTVDNFLGLNRLTNFIKFQGAVLEFLQIDGVDNQTPLQCASGTTFGEWFSASNARTPVVTGGKGGFSGTLKLSIPWKNGSLDIHKVDADAYIDPLELRFQPSSIKWFLDLWEIVKDSGKNSREHAVYMTKESVYFNAASHLSSSVTSNDKAMPCKESSPSDFCSPMGKQTVADVLLPESRLISDWVPCSISKNQKDWTEEEPDFGASVEQFFECFDGMRNSQSALGNSGMWNWTCSVFSAITTATNLASGSLHVPSEQQLVETNLKATLAGISVLFSLLDGDHEHSCDVGTNVGSRAHYLGAKFEDMVLVLQVCPQEMNFKGTVKYIELNDHFTNADDAGELSLHGCNDVESQMLMIQQMQAAVQVALPTFSCSEDDDSEEFTADFHSTTPVWIDALGEQAVKIVLGLLKEIGSSFAVGRDGAASKGLNSRNCSSFVGEVKRGSCRNLMKSSPEELLRGERRKCSSHCSNSKYNFSQEIFFNNLTSLHFNMGNIDIYLITASSSSNVGSSRDGLQRQIFSAENILCSRNRRGRLSHISMFWDEGSLTGPWIAKRAKLLATSKDSRGRNSFVGKGYEFASVTTAKDMEDQSDLARKEMILSSAFFLHVYLSPVKINLSSSQYRGLHCLLQQATEEFSCAVHDPISVKSDSAVTQTSILVECDSVEISVSLEMVESDKGSIQRELPGSWHHFKLQIEKFQFLSMSNVGGICGSNFIWVTHGEGCLWGSITGAPDKEFLLISCTNSTMGRGDGEGSNVLSSKFSGSDIIHLWDPETPYSYMSITVRCSTLVAVGGRMDWLDAIVSFFSLPSPENEQAVDNSLKNGNSAESVHCESSFVLNLLDVGLSYEPYLQGLINTEVLDSESSSLNLKGGIRDNYVACLLAASSLKLSNTEVADCINSGYKITVQDLGLLLCLVSGPENVVGTYSVEHLHKVGYVKVARDPHFEANLRMNFENGLHWELECSESHAFLDTCHDTTSGLIHLAAQLQQIFAPDMEESIIHLQTRYDSQSGVVNLMDEICEDAFHWDGRWDGLSDSFESQLSTSVDDRLLEETFNLIARNPESIPLNISLESSQPSLLQESSPQFSSPQFIESYFLTELHSLSKLSQEKKSANEIPRYESRNNGKGDVDRVNIGWYGDASLKILEDHVSDVSIRSDPQQLVVEEATTSDRDKFCDYGKVRGRVLFKKINVFWRMYAGSDWHNFQKSVQNSPLIRGRDRTVCLELALSGMEFQYEVYPEGVTFVSRLSLSVQDFHLSDNSQDAPWKLVVGYYQSKDHPRKSSSKALKLKLETVRPDPLTPLEEYRLRVAFLPLLLHLHQSQLDFLISFFGGKNSSVDQSPNAHQDLSEPEMFPEKSSNLGGHTISEEALLPFFQARNFIILFIISECAINTFLLFPQKFDVWPGLVRVDYMPCRVDLAALRGGKYVELVNLVPWKGVELQLKHVHAVGVYGWGSVCETIIGEWLEDISQNQVYKLLRGLPPIKSLVAVGSGAAKLVSLPVKNYKKDHRLVKGMQRGTIAFLRSISVEAVGLGVHLAAGAHDICSKQNTFLKALHHLYRYKAGQKQTLENGILECCLFFICEFLQILPVFKCRLFWSTAYILPVSLLERNMMSAIALTTTLLDFEHEGPLFFFFYRIWFSFAVCSNSMPRLPRGEATYMALPSFGMFLISQAYESISDGLGKSASALVRTPLKRYQRGDGAGSAFVSAIQAAAATAPASAAARAVYCALLGVRNNLDPEHKEESIKKYLGAAQPRQSITDVQIEKSLEQILCLLDKKMIVI